MRTVLTSKDRDIKLRCVERLNQLPDTNDMSVYGPMVLDIFRGVPSVVWWVIDNEIGNGWRGYTRGHLVRRVRNDRYFGALLFKALGKD